MFNPPTKRQRIKQAERRIVPISPQTALTPDIKKAALERNTRVLREKKFKDSFEVDSFIEKPKKQKAMMLHRKGALWNSGIVVVKNSYLKT